MQLCCNIITGQACRLRVIGRLSHLFATPAAAEVHYHQQKSARLRSPVRSSRPAPQGGGQPSSSAAPDPVVVTDAIATFRHTLTPFNLEDQLRVLSALFSELVKAGYNVPDIPLDFLSPAASGMKNLIDGGRLNVIYLLAKAVGTKRADNSDTLLPVRRMPMGLLEYSVAFFTCTAVQQVLASGGL